MHKIRDSFADPLLDDMLSREVLVDNRENSSELEDYQVDFAIDEKQLFFEAQDGLRFVDENLKIIDHWNESFPGKQWIEVPKIAGSTIVGLRMLNGSPSLCSASNGDSTFKFFDDFEGSSLNMNKWDKIVLGSGNVAIANSIATLTPSTGTYDSIGINTDNTFGTSNINVQAHVYFEKTWSNAARYHSMGFGSIAGFNSLVWISDDGYYYWGDSDRNGRIYMPPSVVPIAYCTDWSPANTWFTLQFYYLSNGEIGKIENENAAETVINTARLSTNKKVGLSAGHVSNYGGKLKADLVFVREYSLPSPTAEIGAMI